MNQMDIQTIRQRILEGDLSDKELSVILNEPDNHTHARTKGGSFLKTILKGFIEVYTAPNMWRLTLEAILILIVVVGIIILSYAGRIEAMITSVLLAFVLGFLFGKIK